MGGEGRAETVFVWRTWGKERIAPFRSPPFAPTAYGRHCAGNGIVNFGGLDVGVLDSLHPTQDCDADNHQGKRGTFDGSKPAAPHGLFSGVRFWLGSERRVASGFRHRYGSIRTTGQEIGRVSFRESQHV